jgi:hypothetical protein
MEAITMEILSNVKIQIPDEVIRNSIFVLDSNSFAIYAYLKYKYFRNRNNAEIELDIQELKDTLHITDNRTLKKCLIKLHDNNIIIERIEKLPTRKVVTINFIPDLFITEKFTQLPATILNKIDVIGTTGLRLLYYYESFVNRTERLERQFAFPSLLTIGKALKINKDTVIEYNRILHKNDLVSIIKHELKHDGEYNEQNKQLFIKYNNHYRVQVQNL